VVVNHRFLTRAMFRGVRTPPEALRTRVVNKGHLSNVEQRLGLEMMRGSCAAVEVVKNKGKPA